jgi:UDP-N-acetylmuramoylalanine--D-glutamate ligase
MIKVTCFAGKRVALFGLGGSGRVAARALIAGGADVTAGDDQAANIATAAAEGIPTGDLASADWSGFDALILSPGIPLTHPVPHWVVKRARGADVEIIGDIELFVRERQHVCPQAPLIAITGTNGKSTTTALIHHVLQSAGRLCDVGGNLGPAVLGLSPFTPERHYVVECSSFQIDLAPGLDPTVGIHLNLTPDHLDRHGTVQNYAAIKEQLLSGVPRTGLIVCGVDDGPSEAMADRAEMSGARVERLSVRRPVSDGFYLDGHILMRARAAAATFAADMSRCPALKGAHNAQNAAAAFAAATHLGLDDEEIRQGLETFPGLAHRMERVGRVGNVLFVNDSKATNADATEKALSSYETLFWIVGGKAKDGGITSLNGFFPKIVKAYLIGEAADAFAATLGSAVSHEICGTLERAVEAAAHDAGLAAGPEPVVLLSPACASYDQFPNFEVRGAAFREAVRKLPGVTAP